MKNNKELEQITNILEGLERIIDARERLLTEQPWRMGMIRNTMGGVGAKAAKGIVGVIKRGVGDVIGSAKAGLGMAGAQFIVDKAKEGYNKLTGNNQQQQQPQ